MAKYKKRADGRYMTHVTIDVKDDGKPLRKTIYAKTIRELEEKIAEIRTQVSTGIVITNEKTTVGEWSVEWLKTYKNNVERNTRLMYEIMINAHIIPYFGQMLLKDVRPHHIQKLINNKLEIGSVRTAQKILLTLKQIFKKAIENNLIVKNPAETIENPTRDKPPKRSLTDIEKSYIETADLDLKSRAFLYTLLYAGLRKGEALALMRKDIDLKNKTICVDKTLITIANQAEIKPSPKTKAGNRTIPMPDILKDILEQHLSESDTLYVFTSATENIMSKIAFRRFWEKIIKRLNLAMGGNDKINVISKDITPHLFRHTYATMLYYSGVDMKTAQYLLGHSTINITMEIYTHLDTSKTKSAADKLNNLISSSQKVVKEETNT